MGHLATDKDRYMTIRLFLFAVLAVAMAASCGSENNADGGDGGANGADAGSEGGMRTVTLTANAPETRVGLTKKSNTAASLYWHSSDSIYVQTLTNGVCGGAKFGAVSGTATGSTSATFTGKIASSTELGTYAAYPYNENHSFTSATALSYNLPSTYTYDKVESGIFSKTVKDETTYRSTNTNIPMLGTIADGKITFRLIGGLAVIRIDSMPGTDGTLKVTADQQLCGNFEIANVAEENVAIATSTSETNNSVTFSFTGATADSVGVFFLPLATGSYTNVSIAVTCGGTTQTAIYGDLNVKRCSVTAIALYNNGGTLYTKDSEGNYIIDGHAFVDLGLSSGLLWATTNVGATLPADYGNYYAWGETEPKGGYYMINYKYWSSKLTKYTTSDKLTTLEATDDAATVNWGSACRMPTNAEFEELLASCACTKTQLVNSQGESINGCRVADKTDNSRFVFFPCAGFSNADSVYLTNNGYYWSSMLSTTKSENEKAYYMFIFQSILDETALSTRYYGYTVRPVTAVKATGE